MFINGFILFNRLKDLLIDLYQLNSLFYKGPYYK